MANVVQNLTIDGLGTVSWTCPAATTLLLDGKISLPQLTDDGSSGASAALMTINQNGSPVYTGQAGAEGFRVNNITAALNDVFTFVLTSSATVDQALNVIKGVIAISSGG